MSYAITLIVGIITGFVISDILTKRRKTMQETLAKEIILNRAMYGNYTEYRKNLN
tara:strand:+ start:276 stop:440 length:165 start_codon:yes stop_codon:yes gene_type:complete